MKLSFEDEESFKEAVGSLCFNNPPLASDANIEYTSESVHEMHAAPGLQEA